MITGLSHVSIVVPDLAAAARASAQDMYGLVVGEAAVNEEQGVRLAYVELANARIELMEPSRARFAGREVPRAQSERRHPSFLSRGRRRGTHGRRDLRGTRVRACSARQSASQRPRRAHRVRASKGFSRRAGRARGTQEKRREARGERREYFPCLCSVVRGEGTPSAALIYSLHSSPSLMPHSRRSKATRSGRYACSFRSRPAARQTSLRGCWSRR